jgi:NADH:ubiquinone reductase (H+-translocating)
MSEVVVVGGGYAGVLAANRLTGRADVNVTLINPRPVFVERIRLHQLVGGTSAAVVDFEDLLNARVRLVVDSVTGIDAPARRLALAGGDTLGYDYLIYAVGSTAALPVPGAAEFGYPIASLEDAQRLRAVIGDGPLTVVGAGPTGIETATELAESGHRVTLVGPLGPYLHPRARRSLSSTLARLGVTVVEQEVTAVTRSAVRLDDGRELPSGVTVWTAGFGVPDLALRSGLRTDAIGRLCTDETLTSVDDPHIVAAGDSAALAGQPVRMSCQAAGPLGVGAADTVLSRLAGRRPAPVSVGFVGQCISLGRRAGLVQLARRDDVAIGFHLAGRVAARVKETVCRSTVTQLKAEARRPGTARIWLTAGKRREKLVEV